MTKKRVKIEVSGLVQGVAFRYYAIEVANSLNLTGWVKNLSNGQVEILAEGEERDIKKLIAWCHQGPPAAQVDQISTSWSQYQGEFKKFKIAY